ncbi:MAG: nucleoside monophosphate kinase, partial [Candidatus Omnitrophica bacterium]|nr:nucleoside monophosphate kinase [Candidatus Omnitrophota bacterium]
MKAIIFGSPGSGKGTQAVILSEYLKLKKISLGDI